MAVQVKAQAFLELVDEDAELEQLGTGFTFTEGPIWNPDGFLLFSDMPGDVRRRWDPDSGVTEVARPSNKGNGMTIDNDGRLIVCEHVTSSVVRMDPDGKGGGRDVLATHYEGRELNSPNDVVVKSDGALAIGRVLADGIGSGSLEVGDLVDGMKLDERGNVWVTGPGGVCVFNPDGDHIGTVEVPENVGNINWGGPDWSWLFIPATTSVYRIQCKVSGNRLPYMR